MEIVPLIIAIAIPLGGSFLIQCLVTSPNSDWYKNLTKPSWTPPGWAFPVVWTILYVLMGVASWLVWKEGGFDKRWRPLALYILQLVLNFLWTPLFFGFRKIGLAFIEIIILWVAILATAIAFWPVSKLASLLLVPYLVWVFIATSLNGFIFFNNPAGGGQTISSH